MHAYCGVQSQFKMSHQMLVVHKIFLVISRKVKVMLKLQLMHKAEAKMHKLDADLCILDSALSVSCNFCIMHQLYTSANQLLGQY